MEPLLGEVKIFAGLFAPRGWAYCDGQLLPINNYQALFSILGTTYGGDGRTTFALPDLRGRVALGPRQGPGLSSYRDGQRGGVETVTLTVSQMPEHNHTVQMKASNDEATTEDPSDAYLASGEIYSNSPNVHLAPVAVGLKGGNQPIENRQPYLAINYIIALEGVFPSRS